MLYGTFAALVAATLFYITDPYGNPRYRGPVSDHFDGKRFYNPEPFQRHGFRDFVNWQLHAQRGFWPELIEKPCVSLPPRTVEGGGMRVTFINHSTALIQTAGLNILTDPVWSRRVGPVSWLGPRRHRTPGLRLDDLPPIDVILLSHNHYDHLDIPTLRIIAQAHHPQFIVPLGVKAVLDAKTLGTSIELDWWDASGLPRGMRVTAVPARHFSGRGFRDQNNALWCGYVLETPGGRIYFAGDTGYGPHLAEIASKFAPLRLALLPIGAYKPAWFMAPVHISPQEAVRAHQELESSTSVGIHFGAFALADDGEQDPVTDLERALDEAGIPKSRFWALEAGEGRDVPLTPAVPKVSLRFPAAN
ncbi:MAG TPA: MBL fold metallo-hydrolase [Terriglobia bacterium]|nr:MBL fold metallo-hydrolase [Terriglobia bacterium]